MASKKGGKGDGLPGKPVPVAGGKYKRTQAVTLPVLKLVEEVASYVKVTGAMFIGSAQKAKPGEKQMEPATLMPVTNVETGEVGQIIVGAAFKGILGEKYPADSYVGKAFEITKHAKAAGKRYATFSVFEIEA